MRAVAGSATFGRRRRGLFPGFRLVGLVRGRAWRCLRGGSWLVRTGEVLLVWVGGWVDRLGRIVVWTDDLDSARFFVVVCGPAAAI